MSAMPRLAAGKCTRLAQYSTRTQAWAWRVMPLSVRNALGEDRALAKVWSGVFAVVLLAVVVSACGDSVEDESTPSPTVAATAQPAPTATPVAAGEPTATPAAEAASSSAVETGAADPTPVPPTRAQSIILYDLTEIEKTCPGYQEFSGFRQTVSQVKITCTGPGVETVYFVDLDNLVVTGIRVPLLEPEIP